MNKKVNVINSLIFFPIFPSTFHIFPYYNILITYIYPFSYPSPSFPFTSSIFSSISARTLGKLNSRMGSLLRVRKRKRGEREKKGRKGKEGEGEGKGEKERREGEDGKTQ